MPTSTPHPRRLPRGVARTPLLVALTDLADLPPHFWLEPGLDRVLVATDEAATQAARIGLPSAAIVRTSGMILHRASTRPARRRYA